MYFQAARKFDVLFYRKPRIQAVVLKHHGAIDTGPSNRIIVDMRLAAAAPL